MLRADTAGRFEEFTQPTAGAVQLDGERIRTDAALSSQSHRALARKIHAADQVAILLRQFGQEALEAGAEQPCFLGIGRSFGLRLITRERSLPRLTTAVEVNDRPAEDAVEPAHGLCFGRLMFRGDGLEQTLLHSIARQFGVAQLRASEAGEGIQILQQGGSGIGHERTLTATLRRFNSSGGVMFREPARLF